MILKMLLFQFEGTTRIDDGSTDMKQIFSVHCSCKRCDYIFKIYIISWYLEKKKFIKGLLTNK